MMAAVVSLLALSIYYNCSFIMIAKYKHPFYLVLSSPTGVTVHDSVLSSPEPEVVAGSATIQISKCNVHTHDRVTRMYELLKK